MPYTHYWRRPPELEAEAFVKVVADVRLIVQTIGEMGIDLAGPDGTGLPLISGATIAFNGVRECGHRFRDLGYTWPASGAGGISLGNPEIVGNHGVSGALLASRSCGGSCAGRMPMGAFFVDRVFRRRVWDQLENGLYFQFCETDFKPYDLAVMSSLIRFKERFPNDFYVRTERECEDHWDEAHQVCRELFGWSSAFVFENIASPNWS